ncbi:MAG: DUF3373 family protein [Thermodesulfobacteriota bacterium]|nr:DUF3373 family protein [Thermodesulfobacteriota bacterium]
MAKRLIMYLFGFAIGFVIIPLTSEAYSHEDLKLMEEDIAELSDRLDKVETKSIFDRIIVGGKFRTRMDYIRYKDTTASGVADDTNTEDIWSNRLRLNLRADITDGLVFHGRLSCFKLWGESNFDGIANDFNRPSIPDSAGNLHIERAYIDYMIRDPYLSISIGRIPTTGGPPGELRENQTRKASYPKLLIDAEIDAVFFSLHLDEFTDLEESMLGFAYVKFFQNWLDYRGIDMNETTAPTVIFEMQVPCIENSFLWIAYVHVFGWPALTSLPPAYEALGYSITSFPEELGEIDTYFFHIQFDDINEHGLDWFLSYMYSKIDPSSEGSIITTPLFSYKIGLFGDSLNGNLGEPHSFSAIYTGLRYELPIDKWKNPKIGFEYNHGSKYWSAFATSGSGDLISKLMVRGDAYEVYYIQPIGRKNIFLRLGFIYMDHEYENPFLLYGGMTESDMTVTNAYLLMDVLF